MSAARLKLDEVRTLLVSADRYGGAVLVHMLQGLGLGLLTVAESGADAHRHLAGEAFDLCICDSELPDVSVADFIRGRRRSGPPARFLPTMALAGFSSLKSVSDLRDAGASLVIKKPASPPVLFDRIAWLAQPSRAFIECEAFIGTDRRIRRLGPPNGVGRRATDLSAELGAATEPNMSQSEIDEWVKPTRIATE